MEGILHVSHCTAVKLARNLPEPLRRLSKDYEALPATSDAWIRIAMIQLMLRRLVH